jgi:flavin reductase (DIM6/NTAB) family NADH-FMN oxidoreductase RutF
MAVPFDTDAMHTVDPSQLPGDVLYPLIISAIVPRPIAFVSTLSASGVGNLAPFSYFNVMAHNPPHVCIGFAASRLRPHGRKDTLFNLLETGEFVVNIMSEWFIEAANYCCGNFEYGEDEMELSGLTPLPSVKVKPPRVKESAVHMECQLRHSYEVKDNKGAVTGTIVIGEVVMMHVHEGVAGRSPSGKLVVSMQHYQPVSRLGGNTYARTSGMYDLPRPDRGPDQKELAYTSRPSAAVLSN